MKAQRIFLPVLILLFSGCSAKKHMEFNNIQINGNLDKFVNELIVTGFSVPQLVKENQIRLNGVFFEEDCEINVYGTSKSQTVYKVVVNLPGEIHDSIEHRFEKLKELFSSKFGPGTSRYQQFQNSERFLFNEPKRLRHLSQGDFTRFTTGSGEITMVVRDGYISITYLDKQNNEIWKKETGEVNLSNTVR